MQVCPELVSFSMWLSFRRQNQGIGAGRKEREIRKAPELPPTPRAHKPLISAHEFQAQVLDSAPGGPRASSAQSG